VEREAVVHAAFMAALADSYATVVSADELLAG
jgi:acyl-coenzyme A thioesterase PaaI-like protein